MSYAFICAEEEGQDEYLLALESSDMANLCADVAALGFLGGAGVTPSRLLRVGHALTRVALMTLSGVQNDISGHIFCCLQCICPMSDLIMSCDMHIMLSTMSR